MNHSTITELHVASAVVKVTFRNIGKRYTTFAFAPIFQLISPGEGVQLHQHMA